LTESTEENIRNSSQMFPNR